MKAEAEQEASGCRCQYLDVDASIWIQMLLEASGYRCKHLDIDASI